MPCLDVKTPMGHQYHYADWDEVEKKWRCLDCDQLSEPGSFHDRMCPNWCGFTTDTHLDSAPDKCPDCGVGLVEYAD